tara:strand:+ start:215874 stop:216542 length:669 start_codon:yes stop_codon:yes gene_type:complete
VALSAAEEESIDAIKRWWNESGRQIALGIAAVALVYFGWQFWQNSQTQASAQASAVYDRLSALAVAAPGEMISEEARTQAEELIATLKSEHGDSVYALYGALFGARLAVENDDLAGAQQELEWLLANTRSGLFGSTDETLVQLAQLRLGRVLLASDQTERALTLISGVSEGSLQAEFEELRGDIYLAQGQRDEALRAYQTAADLGSANPVLQMKISELQGSL